MFNCGAHRAGFTRLLCLTAGMPDFGCARTVEARKHFDSVLIDAVVRDVREAPKDRPSVSYRNLGKGVRTLGNHIHRIFERPEELGTESGSPLVVPLPG